MSSTFFRVTRRGAAGLVGALALWGAAAADEVAEPSISASPQPAGPSVTIDQVVSYRDGWLVIHAVRDGKPVVPGSIGHAPIRAGVNRDVTVMLSEPTAPGTKVLAMLHVDTGRIGSYEFGPGSTDVDRPVVLDGKPVVAPVPIR